MSLSNIAAIPKNVNPAANIISTIINSIKNIWANVIFPLIFNSPSLCSILHFAVVICRFSVPFHKYSICILFFVLHTINHSFANCTLLSFSRLCNSIFCSTFPALSTDVFLFSVDTSSSVRVSSIVFSAFFSANIFCTCINSSFARGVPHSNSNLFSPLNLIKILSLSSSTISKSSFSPNPSF